MNRRGPNIRPYPHILDPHILYAEPDCYSEMVEVHPLSARKCKGSVAITCAGPSTSQEKMQQPQPFISDTYDKFSLLCSTHDSASSTSPAVSTEAQIDARVFILET